MQPNPLGRHERLTDLAAEALVAIVDHESAVEETAPDGRVIKRTPVVKVSRSRAAELGRTVPVLDPTDGIIYVTPQEASHEAEAMASFTTCMGPASGPTEGQQRVAADYHRRARDFRALHALQHRSRASLSSRPRIRARPRGAGRPRARAIARASSRSGDSGDGSGSSSGDGDPEPPPRPLTPHRHRLGSLHDQVAPLHCGVAP